MSFDVGSATPVRSPHLSWSLLLRLLLLVLPGQLAGTFVAVTVLDRSGLLRDRPGLGTLIVVGAGLFAGLVIGLVLRPGRPRILACTGAAAAVGAVVFAGLLGAAQLRMPTGSSVPLRAFLQGAPIAVAVQTATAVILWLLRTRPRS